MNETSLLKLKQRRRRDLTVAIFVLVFVFFAPLLIGEFADVRFWESGGGGRLWQWYLGKLEAFPLRAIFVPFEFLMGAFGVYILRSQTPDKEQLRPGGISFKKYFWVETLFWFVALVELPVAILLTLIQASLVVHLVLYGLILLMIFCLYGYMKRNPKFKPKIVRRRLTPLIAMTTPGISLLGRLHRMQWLPKPLGNAVEWIVTAIQSVVMSTAKLVLIM